MKGATIFSGGEGIGVGMRLAGIEHLWGIEYDDKVAQVARDNSFHSITADVREINVRKLERPDILHASPVCKNASVAKTNGKGADEDIETAFATCRFIDELKPDIFTLENVWGYRNFRAFQVILDDLTRNGYKYEYWHLNAANFGVPQTRKRLILVARLHGTPRKPQQTHAKKAIPLFDTLKPWISWYKAIEDLIPTLPESQFAQWQLDRLPDTIKTIIVGGANTSDEQAAPGVGVSEQDEPTRCVASNAGQWKAFVIDGENVGHNSTIRRQDMPVYTISSSQHGSIRAWLSTGRVVAMTPRCLARFQSFPDWYKLTESNALNCKVIRNAVPPLLYQRVIEAQIVTVS